MDHVREREGIVAFARRLEADGLALGTSGNLSIRVGDRVLITPSAVDYEELTPDLVCVVDIDGKAIENERKPSTELPMHLAAYASSDARAVVHGHPPFSTALSTVIDELPAIHYLVAELGGPVRVARYFTPGSPELADEVGSALEGRNAVLLANHGSLTLGASLREAYARARLLEWVATVYHRARAIGEMRILTDAEVEDFAAKLQEYGRP